MEDSQALKITSESGFTVHDVYVEALGLGIYPYRYIRNRETISPEEQLKLSKTVESGKKSILVTLLIQTTGTILPAYVVWNFY